jgi:hypothetical protein
LFEYLLYFFAIAFLVFSYIKDRKKTIIALSKSWKAFLNILPAMAGVLALIGLVLSILTPENIEQILGHSRLCSLSHGRLITCRWGGNHANCCFCFSTNYGWYCHRSYGVKIFWLEGDFTKKRFCLHFLNHCCSNYRDGVELKIIKPYLLLVMILIADVLLLLINRDLGIKVAVNTGSHILQMLAILPPIFVLIGLLDAWVPREQFMRYMGEKSGINGIVLSVLLGAAAAGPLYAAFPLAAIMIQKGVKFSNILIFLGAWSTMKIPLFLFEITSLGSSFAITRWLVSLVGIIVMALIINRLISADEKVEIYARHLAK